jgi:ABC-type nickel/cobalt efflux system permease component RcnA
VLSFLAILFLGFLLGMRHATDPDHVVAVTTIVTKQRGIAKAGLIGVLWGLGHTFTIFVVGTMIILFQVTIPPRVGLSMELTVAAMLVLLGVLNLTGTLRWLQDKFTPNSGLPTAVGLRSDADLVGTRCCDSAAQAQREGVKPKFRLPRMLQSLGFYNVLRPLVIGIIHGLAGSAAVALLVITTIRDPWWAITYLFLFGIGTIVGMMIITAVIAMPFAFTVRRFSGWNRGMALASGLLSLGFGLFLTYQIGFVDGLFTTHPQWTPR